MTAKGDPALQGAKPHGFVTKGIHWVSAGLLAYGYVKGLEDVSQLADPALLQFEVAFAAMLGVVFLVRFAWTTWIATGTRLPKTAPKWEHAASRTVHLGLYAGVFLIVLSGLGIALGYTTPMLGGVFLAAMLALHETSLVVLPAVLGIHIIGALWHRLVRRDGVFESMMPGFQR